MVSGGYEKSVFINCPFDAAYAPLFEAIVFAVQDAGFRPRSARERLDSSQVRLHKIVELISESRYSIHDLSRTEIDDATALPRFNMPLELGLDLGCKTFSADHRDKSLLIFDSEKYRFQRFISDIGGQDIHHHQNDPSSAVTLVRHWLRTEAGVSLPGPASIHSRYLQYRSDLPAMCRELRLDLDDLAFADFSQTIALWIERKDQG